MGWTQRRRTKNGGVRYRYRDLRGQIQAAGTFSTKREADRAWQRAETRLAEGRLGNPRRGRQTFRRYVTEEWLPHHVMEATTREGYTYQLNKHIMPWFGPRPYRSVALLPGGEVRPIDTVHSAGGVPPVGTMRRPSV